MKHNIYLVGIGPGKEEMMTGEALKALEAADVIIGYTVYIKLLGERFADKEMRTTPMRQEEERCKLCFEEAKKGDKLCLLAIDEMVDILGEGIANICYVINPEVVVLGGGIMAQEQFLKERVECAVKRYLVSSIEEHTKIVFAKHQNDAGMLGAFYHFCSLH